MRNLQKVKYFTLGVVLTLIFSTMLSPVMASLVQKQITVTTGVSIYMDDVKLNPVDANGKAVEVFIYNGTTYLPVRAVADAVGKPVSWDAKTNSVYLGKHESDEPAILLKDLDYFSSHLGLRVTNDNIKDNLGNEYIGGIYSYGGFRTNTDASHTYNINGMYSKLKGRYILGYESRSTKEELRFRVYGDGRLLYNSPVVTGGSRPIDFEVDLKGVLELKVEFTSGHSKETYLVNTGLYQ